MRYQNIVFLDCFGASRLAMTTQKQRCNLSTQILKSSRINILLLFFLSFLILLFSSPSIAATSAPTPAVVIVTTGGTIAQKVHPKNGMTPAINGKDLVQPIALQIKDINTTVIDFANIDSSQITPETWVKLSSLVNHILEDPNVSGVVITHGTDTLAETAYFLDLTITSNKPVVLTGAMHSSSYQSPDGPSNLYNSIMQAGSAKNYNWGVTLNLNQYINSARFANKIHTDNIQAFSSSERGYLGYITRGEVKFFHDRPNRLHIPLPKQLPKVVLLKTYVGDDGALLRAAVQSGAEGIVIEGFGAGNVHANLYDVIKKALAKKIPVVMTTSVPNGSVYPIYGVKGGGLSLFKIGVIFAGDLTGPKARILLMLALSQVGNNLGNLQKYFSEEYN